VVPLLVIGVLGVLAAVAGEDIIFKGQIKLFEDFQINQLFFGQGVPALFDGGGDVDHIMAMLARAFFLMVVFGLPAAVTFGIYKVTKRVKAHLFLTNWCAVLLLFVVTALFHEQLLPILSALF
jgi:hypothetical protein